VPRDHWLEPWEQQYLFSNVRGYAATREDVKLA
jgi:hypothetical protein